MAIVKTATKGDLVNAPIITVTIVDGDKTLTAELDYNAAFLLCREMDQNIVMIQKERTRQRAKTL